ncbi:hypothetical protein KCTC52924_02535 [Arenibacter antarcticus]
MTGCLTQSIFSNSRITNKAILECLFPLLKILIDSAKQQRIVVLYKTQNFDTDK